MRARSTLSGGEAALRAFYAIRLGDWAPSGLSAGETAAGFGG